MRDASFQKMIEGYGLTTARIFYHLPDARSIINEFTWQFYDLYPRFPRLNQFLDYWQKEIESPIHSITLTHARLIKPAELRLVEQEFRLN